MIMDLSIDNPRTKRSTDRTHSEGLPGCPGGGFSFSLARSRLGCRGPTPTGSRAHLSFVSSTHTHTCTHVCGHFPPSQTVTLVRAQCARSLSPPPSLSFASYLTLSLTRSVRRSLAVSLSRSLAHSLPVSFVLWLPPASRSLSPSHSLERSLLSLSISLSSLLALSPLLSLPLYSTIYLSFLPSSLEHSRRGANGKTASQERRFS